MRVIPDVSPGSLLPDASYLPDFQAWDQLSLDEARDNNDTTKRPLNTGAQSPGCHTYHERKRELSMANDDAFQVVRRLPPPKGKQQPRLGNAYEFYRCLESFTTFWPDTSKPPSEGALEVPQADESSPEEKEDDTCKVVRTSSGTSMPNDYRQNLINAFIKLVAYDFGCNTQHARTEPRLHVKAPLPTAVAGRGDDRTQPPSARSSYFVSGCTFIYRSPRTREAARQGLVDGPIAAVSARATTAFTEELDHTVDFARELVAALLTAQHRTREGRAESRPGEGEWWTTKPRWGGGTGGPIGREVDRDAVQGDKDAKPPTSHAGDGSSSSSKPSGMPAAKRPRKQMSIYDNYRMVRPPSASWDPKTRYEAIGKVRGSSHDDIFVVSSLFHHISILRVKVPERLLEVMEGATDEGASRSWGELEVRRSKWYDLFVVEERLEAMKMVWGMMQWVMREQNEEGNNKKQKGDVKMAGT